MNMGSATDCPSQKLGMCSACMKGVRCYALKAEVQYPPVLPYRRRQEKYWKGHTAKEFVSDFLALNARKRRKFDLLRLNEAGDFWGQRSVNKAEAIAVMLKPHGVATYCYTSRRDLDYSAVKDLVINGSGFVKKGIRNRFNIVGSKADMPKGFTLCCGSCRKCSRCSKPGMRTCGLKH
jgi:hypothetical protein